MTHLSNTSEIKEFAGYLKNMAVEFKESGFEATAEDYVKASNIISRQAVEIKANNIIIREFIAKLKLA